MDQSSLLSSLLRGRRPESCVDAAFRLPELKEEAGDASHGFVDDDGWLTVVVSVVRMVACVLAMTITTVVWAVIMLVMLPWPYERIRQGNLYGHFTGRLMAQAEPRATNKPFQKRIACLDPRGILSSLSRDQSADVHFYNLMWILGNPITIKGSEFSDSRAIFICNHASPIDVFLAMWLTPIGTVAIAKKEIIWYPLFGQLYMLANHLRIDRSNPAAAVESLKEASRTIVDNNLSLIIFPEGTRSASGRLLPFKKGFLHIALQTRLPIVPIILTGTHLAWRKNSLRIRPAPITVKYLPPISTDSLKGENMKEFVEMIHSLYVEHLPESQKPLTQSVQV